MGLFGAMTASVSGIGAQGEAISVIADNLSNTNTIGYKASRTLFSQMVTSSGVSGTAYNSGGVDTAVKTDQSNQGSFITSTSKTDLAISGNGFFRVSDSKLSSTSTGYYYTRAGSFSEDKEGYLTNPDGYYLQGWKTDSDGTVLNVQEPQAIELQSVGVSAQATTEFSIDANLNSDADLNDIYASATSLATALASVVSDSSLADYVSDIRVYDAQGGARDMTIAFTKRSANTWDWQLLADGEDIQGGIPGVAQNVGGGTLEFNSTGSLKNVTGTAVSIQWAGGVSASNVTFDFGDYTGGQVVTAQTGEVTPTLTATTNVVTSTNFAANTTLSAISHAALANGTYSLVYNSPADTLELFSGAVSLGTVAYDGATAGTYTVGGVTVTMGAAAPAFAPGATVGTFTVGDTNNGGVLNISAEDNVLASGTYTLRRGSATTMQLVDSLGAVVETATVGASGVREVYFSTNKVRVTVSEGFDETAPVYPETIGTFTVTPQPALTDGLGTDGVTQLTSAFNTSAVNQNGFGAGTLASISVDADGFVNGTFTNGETKKLYKLVLAVFQNPRGLEMVSGSLLRTTEASGQALLKEPRTGGTGSIVGGSLEGSTTDIAGEFSNMIVAQRAFQASSKVITTVDQMLNELLQLR